MDLRELLREKHCRVLKETERNGPLWTLNQRVGGSSPPRLTIESITYGQSEMAAFYFGAYGELAR